MHVGIVGSGISGLYAALLLRQEGHCVTVFEAKNRIGGRIYTYHFPPLSAQHEPAYFEAGAMRIPQSKLHARVFQLVEFLNAQHEKGGERHARRVEFIPYVLETEQNGLFLCGRHLKSKSDTDMFPDFDLPLGYRRPAKELLREVISPWLAALQEDFNHGFQELLQFDELSFRGYLRLVVGWPSIVVDYVELVMSQTNQYDLSFTEIVMQNMDFNTKTWVTIRGGMSRLLESCIDVIGASNILLNAPVERVIEHSNGKVTLETSTGQMAAALSISFDKVLLAIPPAALRAIQKRPTWSFMKEQSIRSSHFEPLYKIGLHFRTRFWENLGVRSCFGGQSTTDLCFRWIVYPSNDMGSECSGVLLLYCWMNDACHIQSMPTEPRLALILHDLQKYFADTKIDIYDQFIDFFDICWSQEYATGDAMFLPGQFTRFYDIAREAERNIYFAGEHLSRHHTWIAGALDSTLYAVQQMVDDQFLVGLGEKST